jgi:hypothetical protein
MTGDVLAYLPLYHSIGLIAVLLKRRSKVPYTVRTQLMKTWPKAGEKAAVLPSNPRWPGLLAKGDKSWEFIAGRHPLTPCLVLRSSIDCSYRKRCTVNDSVSGTVNDAASGGRNGQEQKEEDATVSAEV